MQIGGPGDKPGVHYTDPSGNSRDPIHGNLIYTGKALQHDPGGLTPTGASVHGLPQPQQTAGMADTLQSI